MAGDSHSGGLGGNRARSAFIIGGSYAPKTLPRLMWEVGRLSMERKVSPRYARVESVRRLIFAKQSKVASNLLEAASHVVDETGSKKLKAFTASQAGY